MPRSGPELYPPPTAVKSSLHSTKPLRLKRNVRINGRRTTIVLEPYVWDSIDAIVWREQLGLDEFCGMIEMARIYSSLASATRIVALAYFRILDQLHHPPFWSAATNPDNIMREPDDLNESLSVLPLAIRCFAQDERHD